MEINAILYLLVAVFSITCIFELPKTKIKKIKMMKSIILPKKKKRMHTLKIDQVKAYISDLVSQGDGSDSMKLIKKDYAQGIFIAIVIIAFTNFMGMATIGYLIFFLLMATPIISRITKIKEHKKMYMNSFYKLINYLILYSSGGLNVNGALVEAEKLILSDDVIKPNLSKIVNNRKLAGVAGESLIENLTSLNDGVEIDEIEYFVRSLELSIKKGVPINESLKSQLSFIDSKQYMVAKDVISSADSTIMIVKTAFGLGLMLFLFLAPPMTNAIVQFSSGF